MLNRPRAARGFTLIEMMIVVVIVGILAAIALPSYFQYIQRSKIIEATTALSNLRTKNEQYFLDNRTYVGAWALYKGAIQAQVKSFAIDGSTETATTYVLIATGKPSEGMDNTFVYKITQNDVKSSTGPTGWNSGATCWITRKGDTC
jgi:type IV pilus assembly protein PilE